ncbi:MAG: MBL fold metallo-hydrolase [Polyangia bacterium]
MTRSLLPIHGIPGIWRFEVRTPTLPPATHTNVYIVGDGELVVVDPASPYPEERAALAEALASRPEKIAAIFLTHQHLDHVSGAKVLQRATGAPIWAHAETASRLAGRITVDHAVVDGDALPTGTRSVVARLTPGHAPGHLCLLDTRSLALVCGDMVASEGTILVDADDDGDMSIYLASLALMRTWNPSVLLPAHGPPIFDADAHLAHYIAHRLGREARVVASLTEEPRTLDELVLLAYADTPPAIHPLAKRSLKTHLRKLVHEGRAVEHEARWARAQALVR